MRKSWTQALLAILACAGLWFAQPAAAADRGPLVSVQWLEQQLGRDDLVLLDASPPPLYAKRHIAGAVPVDVFSFGARDLPAARMEAIFQALGVSADRTVVLYDQGGTMMATRLFFDLHYHGFPAERLFILDGGLAKWLEAGRPVTQAVTPPKPGTFRITAHREETRVRLPEFLAASGDPARHALVEALEPEYHYGAHKFFDRAGHVPHAISFPTADFFNADKTFKSPEEIGRMARHLGIRPEQVVHAHCGGGVAASVPYFALKFIAGYPNVKLYKESQFEWLQDARQLPFWTYAAPQMVRPMDWVGGWSNKMMRSYGIDHVSVIDVRTPEKYAQGHLPFALNIPAETFRRHRAEPEALARLLGAAGVDIAHEAVIVSDGGLDEHSALAWLMLERLGQQRVSLLMDPVDEWGLRGLPLAKEPTAVGPKKHPHDTSIVPTAYPQRVRAGVVVGDAAATGGAFPKVFIAAGAAAPAGFKDGTLLHLPYKSLLQADGSPKPAKDIWSALKKAGVPRYAEIVCIADDPGEAAAMAYLLRLMGWPDVKVRMA